MSVPPNEKCKFCGEVGIHEAVDNCVACGRPLYQEPPNVRSARRGSANLDQKYKSFRRKANRVLGKELTAKIFRFVQKDLKPIKTERLGNFAVEFLQYESPVLMTSRRQAVRSGTILPGRECNERFRANVDNFLYGEFGDKVVYACLGQNDQGPSFWGSVHLKLKESTIAHRTTTIESNAYKFFEKYNDGTRDSFPDGTIGDWNDRRKIAALKIDEDLSSTLGDEDIERLLFHDTGDRFAEFIELHIAGSLYRLSVESVNIDGKHHELRSHPGSFDALESALKAAAVPYKIA